ncbi:FAM184 domain-containing protein [Chloropicon primus]|nr:FAM184 domain-containing protein [Chloropicon primus]
MTTSTDLDRMEGIQHRMGKKIAQLTKVIYHLNNKNEDHEYDLQDVENQYENEIQTILQDTASKLNRFQAELRTKNDNQRVAQATRKLEEDHGRQVKAYENEIQRLREKSMTVKKQFEHQVSGLMNELQHVKGEFTARLLEFKAIVAKVEENSVSDAKEKVLTLEHALKKAQEELESARQAGNNKYSEMLAERTTKEEELMAKIKAMGEQIQNSEADLRRRLESAQADKDEAVESERCKLADATIQFTTEKKELEAEWKGKVESLIDQLEVEKGKLRKEVERTDDALSRLETSRQELQDTQASTSETIGNLEQKIGGLTKEMEELRQKAESEKAMLQESMNSDVGQVTKRLDASLLARDQLMKDLEEAKAQLKQTQDDLKVTRECQQSLQENMDKLDSDLAAKAKEVSSLEARVKQSEKDVETVKAGRDKFKKESDAKSSEIARLKERISSADKAAGDKTSAAKETARKEMAKRLEATHEDYRKKLEEKERSFKQQLEQARKDAAAKLSKSEDSMRAQMAELRKKLEIDLGNAKKGFEIECSQISESRQKVENELKQEISDLMERLGEQDKLKQEELGTFAQAQKSLQQELADSKQKNAQLQEKLKGAHGSESRLNQKLKDLETSEKEAQTLYSKSLKTQKDLQKSIDGLKEEMSANSEKAKQRLAKELSNLDKEWSKKAETKCKEAMEETIALHAKEVKHLEEKHLAEKEEELSAAREEAQKRMSSLEGDLSTEIARLENDLLDEKALHQKNVKEEREGGESMRREMEMAHKDEVENLHAKFGFEKENMNTEFDAKLKSALDDAMEARMRSEIDLSNVHQGEVEKLKESAAQAAREHRATLEETVNGWEQKLSDHTASLNEKHANEMSDLQKSLSDDFFSQIQASDKKHQLTVKKLEKEAQESSDQISSQGKEIQKLTTSLSSLKDEFEKSQRENSDLERRRVEESQHAAMAMSDLKHSHEDALKRADAAHRTTLQDLTTNHGEEIIAIKMEQEKRILEHEAVFADLTNRYDELDARFQARESREEDLALISELRTEMVRKDEVLEDTMQKMRELKVELLNREESYNKNFANGGSAPTKQTSGQDAILSWMLKSKKEARINSARRKTGQQPMQVARRQSMF